MNPEAAIDETAQQEQPATPKLTYFDVRGRAEVIRLILAEADYPYEERRISIEQWPEVKSNFTFGQIPVYEEGELLLNQPNAIYRYLGRKFDLYGDSLFEQSRCDIVQEVFSEAQITLSDFYWNRDFKKERADFEHKTLPELLYDLEGMFDNNTEDSGYWVGTRLSFVDLMAWHFLDCVRPFSMTTLRKFPKLCRFKDKIENRPRIAAYLKSEQRPSTMTVKLSTFGGTPETS